MSDRNGSVLQPGINIRPHIQLNQTIKLVENFYGLSNTSVAELNGYDDRNFQIFCKEMSANQSSLQPCKNSYVLKIMNSLDSQKIAFVEAQIDMLLFLEKMGFNCPVPVKNKSGDYYSLAKLESGFHIVRLLTYIPGEIVLNIPTTPKIFYEVGRYVAQLDLVLKDFHREVYKTHTTLWMLESIPELRNFLYVLQNETNKLLVEEVITEFKVQVMSNIDKLEKGIIHGDFNEQNLVVRKNEHREWSIYGILDFGDTQYSCLVFELAIAITYMILQAKELDVAGHVIAGYLTFRPIPELEFVVLKICVAARLCQSLVLGAYSNLQHPDNKYVLSTQHTGWKMLQNIWKEPQDILYKRWRQIADNYVYQKDC